MEKKIFILVGASGSGKTTLGNHLKTLGIPELVSHTTRKMRVGEINGETYHFIKEAEFEAIDKVEYSNYSGNFYCLSRNEVETKLEEYDYVFAITDIHGMKQVQRIYPDLVVPIFIFISLEEMEQRMRDRGDNEANIQMRIKNAINNKELSNDIHCKYTIYNGELDQAINNLLQIVLKEGVNTKNSSLKIAQ